MVRAAACFAGWADAHCSDPTQVLVAELIRHASGKVRRELLPRDGSLAVALRRGAKVPGHKLVEARLFLWRPRAHLRPLVSERRLESLPALVGSFADVDAVGDRLPRSCADVDAVGDRTRPDLFARCHELRVHLWSP